MLECIFMMQYCSRDAAAFLRLVGRRATLARESRGITRAQLGNYAGLTIETIAALEQGEYGIEVDQLHRVAEALGLTTPDLLPDEDDVRQFTDSLRTAGHRIQQDPAGGRSAGS